VADRTVKVRLEADISDFVTDIGVKAVAAVNKLERAASSTNKTLVGVGSSKGLEPIAAKADAVSEKLAKVGDTATTTSRKIKESASTATAATEKLAESVSKSEKATTSSSKAVTVASKNADSYASALGRLRIAQLRLSEAQKAGKSGSALAGAEESLAAAERAVKKYEEAGQKSGRAFGSGLRKWLTGNGGASDIGASGGTVFGSGFLGVLKTPILGPAVIAILTGLIVTAMPAVGAVAGGAFVSGFGGGLAALGLVFAAKSDAVKAKWEATLAQLGADMQLLAKPFESTLTNIAGYFERTVDNFNPALGKAFSKLAGPVDQFASDFGRALEKLIPAIDPITTAFSAVLATLGPALSAAIGNISEALIKLSESISQSPRALADLVTGIGGLVGQILNLITTLNNINGAFEKLTGGVSLVNVTFGILGGAVAAVAGPFELLAKGLDLVNAALGRTGKDSDTAGKSMQDAAAKTVALANAHGALGAAAKGVAPPVKSAAEAVAEAKKKIADAKAATDAWISSLFALQNLALSLSGAQISYQAAIDAVTASIKENGRSHDINTAKGRANKSALDAVAKAANDQTEAMLRSNKGNAAAGRSAEASRVNFIKLATQMGYTVPQAKAMAASMIAIPNVLRKAKLEADKKDLDSKLAAARKELADPKLSATKKAKLQAEIKQLLAAKAQAQAAINSLTGKTVAIRINTYKSMIETTTHVDKGVRLPQADGGFWPKGIPSYANGKLPSQAMIAPGKGRGMVQWAEQETGGEAFIPLAPNKRDRSTKILGKVADNFGLSLVRSFADGGFLPGGRLVDIAYLLRQLGIPFNPSAGVNYGSTLVAQRKAVAAAAPAKTAAARADRLEAAAKADVARLQRSITLQQRYVTALRQQGASESKIRAEQKKTIGLQDQLYRAKLKQKAATDASNKADENYRLKAEAATKATEAHKAAIEKLVQQQQAAVDMAAQIADALTAGANIGDLFQNSLTGKGLLQDLQAQGAAVGRFRAQVDRLRKLGLSEELIQQIIGKGAEQGGEVAQAILDGGIGLVSALNKAQKALDDQANLIGAGSANKKYGQLISGARADGGDVYAGKTYKVGERGPELFQPGVTGRILPNQYVGAGAGGGRMTVIHEHHYHQANSYTGVSMAEADLISSRSLAKMRLIGRH
jgi:hypothetical protein